jgi:hypothetical protein
MNGGPTTPEALPNRVRYQRIPGRRFRRAGWGDVLPALTAPVGGSQLIFPHRLANALAAHKNGKPAAVPSAHARWFFGDSLVFWTDPAGLTMRLRDKVHDGDKPVRLARRFLDNGDWRRVTTLVAALPEHVETQELVEFGADYPATRTFRRMIRAIRRNRPFRRYRVPLDSEEKVHAYFRYFLALTESIRTHGFREQNRLAALTPYPGFDVRGAFAFRQRNIGVAIGADGGLLRFLGGRHRLAIAQALEVPAVPVELRLVHLDWLAVEVQRRELPPAMALKQWARAISLPTEDVSGQRSPAAPAAKPASRPASVGGAG